jgi:peptide/nickel transport system substrate-binding protein
VVEKFKDYWNKDNVFIDKITYLPIVDGTVRLANLKSAGLDLIERVLATDIKSVRDNPKLKLSKAVSLGFAGLMINIGAGAKANGPLGKEAKVRQAFELSLDREAINQVGLQRRVRAGQPVGQPAEPVLSGEVPVPKRDRRQGQGALEGGRRQPAR